MTAATFTLHRGTAPLLVSVPHAGTEIPNDLAPAYVERARSVEDTDWHLERIYAFVKKLGASLIVPRFSRYVIDLNRPPDNQPMYAGANNTELCPTRFFTGDELYRAGAQPGPPEVNRRLQTYWRPYHEALTLELARIKAWHGHAVLFDAHSIKSELPWLFEGKLPDLNLGTVQGTSCAPGMRAALSSVLELQSSFTHAIDGRFKGGYITRHYGRPAQDIHALQLEMCWSCYMIEQPPWQVDSARLERLQPVLKLLVKAMLDWKPDE